jgi:hypothetical protein
MQTFLRTNLPCEFRGQYIELFWVGEFAQARFQRDQQTYLIRVACQFNILSQEFKNDKTIAHYAVLARARAEFCAVFSGENFCEDD